MRQPARTPKCWDLPTILHTRQLTTTTNRYPTPTKPNRHTIPPNTKAIAPHTKQLLIWTSREPSPTHSFHGQSPTLRPAPMTSQSPCRSPYRRLHTTSRPATKTRRIRHHTSHHPSEPNIKQPPLPIHHSSPVRRSNNQRHLPTTN